MSIVQSSMEGRTKVKVVLLGDQAVGKTSLIEKFIYDKFHTVAYPTVGIDFLAKDYSFKSRMVRLQLWDTAGQERFRSLIPSYLKDSHCAIIVFDLTNKQSLESVESWLNLYKENRAHYPNAILAGNKSDMATERICEFDEVEQKAKLLGVKYIEVSAKTGQNINELFELCLEQIFQTVLMSSRVGYQSAGQQILTPCKAMMPEPKAFPLRNQILNIQNQGQQGGCKC